MAYNKLASAVYNDIVSGLRGYAANLTLSIEQLEDDIVDERLATIKIYTNKGIINKKELLRQISCLPVDCKDIEGCNECAKDVDFQGTPTMHFEIPQLMTDMEDSGIEYIGSADLKNPFLVYTSTKSLKYHKYRRRLKNKPFVFVNTVPNKNNMYDCWVYNAPFLKAITVIAVFRDERQLAQFGCSCEDDIDNLSFINSEIKDRVTKKKISYYRQLAAGPYTNDQIPK